MKLLKKFNTLKTKVNNLDKKIPDATTLIHINVTTTILNTKISEVENEVPNNSKYIITQEDIHF